MNDKRIRISLDEKRKYCRLIKSGAKYKALNVLYKSKHGDSSVYQSSWLRIGIVKKEELAAFDGSATETFTEVQLIENQLEKMELEEEMEEIAAAQNAEGEIEKEKANEKVQKNFTQSKIISFSKNNQKINFNSAKMCLKLGFFWWGLLAKMCLKLVCLKSGSSGIMNSLHFATGTRTARAS